jgi:LmbE family N-acetylglucosaminyl deacetylase
MVVTKSSYKNAKGEKIREEKMALKEGKEAAKIMGATLIPLGYETFEIPFNEELTKTITGYIEELKIDTIYSHWTNDLHRDHQYAARNTLMAGRHVPRFLMYRSNYYNTDIPFHSHFYVDISDVMEKKIEVIKAHKSELERVRFKWLDFFIKQNANDGQRIGVEYAESFQIVRYLLPNDHLPASNEKLAKPRTKMGRK